MAIAPRLRLPEPKLTGQGDGEQALGVGRRPVAAECFGSSKQVQASPVGFRVIELMRVQELLPLPLPRLGQRLGGRKGFHESPGGPKGPIVKGLENHGIILVQRRPQLTDERRSLFDQSDFVATQQTARKGASRMGFASSVQLLCCSPYE